MQNNRNKPRAKPDETLLYYSSTSEIDTGMSNKLSPIDTLIISTPYPKINSNFHLILIWHNCW